jgi:hypothetical protein
MPGRDILGNDALVAPATFDPRRRVIVCVLAGPPSNCPFKGVKTESMAHLQRNSVTGATQPTARMAAMGGDLPFRIYPAREALVS